LNYSKFCRRTTTCSLLIWRCKRNHKSFGQPGKQFICVRWVAGSRVQHALLLLLKVCVTKFMTW